MRHAIEDLLGRIKAALAQSVRGVDVEVALDSYDVLDKINSAAGRDIVIIDVGGESAVGDYPEVGVVEIGLDIYVARSFGLADLDGGDYFKRSGDDQPLWTLRNSVRDAIRDIVIPDPDRHFETNYLLYTGARRFETPYNLRAASFILNFKITGVLPAPKSQTN